MKCHLLIVLTSVCVIIHCSGAMSIAENYLDWNDIVTAGTFIRRLVLEVVKDKPEKTFLDGLWSFFDPQKSEEKVGPIVIDR